MDRRDFISRSAAGAFALAGSMYLPARLLAGTDGSTLQSFSMLGQDGGPQSLNCGWIDSVEAKREFVRSREKPFFHQWNHDIRGSGEGKVALLWKAYEKVTGKPFEPRDQGDTPQCVGFGTALAVDTLGAVQIVVNGKAEEWHGDCSSEAIYAGSKVEIAGKPGGGGSNGVWAANWLQSYGVVYRGKYGDIDLTNFDPKLAKKWASSRSGLPPILEQAAKEHPVETISRVEAWEEACDAVVNGYSIILCSDQGFNSTRDSDGFLRPVKTWAHCMCLWGVDSLSKRQGGCIANSWGSDWVKGPDGPNGCPTGCFWADAKVIDRMLKQHDSYAISNLRGYPRREIDYSMS